MHELRTCGEYAAAAGTKKSVSRMSAANPRAPLIRLQDSFGGFSDQQIRGCDRRGRYPGYKGEHRRKQHNINEYSHVALGEKHLLNQKLLIQRLEAGGRDASAVQSMLTQFEELQGMHIAGVVRLEKELAKSRNEPF